MNEHIPKSDAWDRCPDGTLGQVVRQMKSRRRGRRIATAAGPVTGLVLLVIAGALIVQQSMGPGEHRFGGIYCSEVQSVLADYQLGTLDSQLAGQVAVHLDQCPVCRPLFESMQTNTRQVSHIQQVAARQCDCQSCRHDESTVLAWQRPAPKSGESEWLLAASTAAAR